ncbi:single-stranded DNA-binding protein [Salinicoccus siamensis]|uniref:Single-stranded DNA-binding protein n=1 Tax=Salinicoccus siamensis TaxID=381830 RepID=A0ABV5Z5R7_9STAP
MMNKVLLVGELVRNVTVQKTVNGSINSFIIATVRVPKDERKSKEVHFIYCKAFGKALPKVLTEAAEGDILCVSGQVATTVHTTQEGEKEYRMEIWAESIKHIPDKISRQKDITNPSRMIGEAVKHYDQWDYIGERTVHTLESSDDSGKALLKDRHLESLEKVLNEHKNDSHTLQLVPNEDSDEKKEKAFT